MLVGHKVEHYSVHFLLFSTSNKRRAPPQLINRIHATHFIHTLIRILHYVKPINHN